MGLDNEQRYLNTYRLLLLIRGEVDPSKISTFKDYPDRTTSIMESCDQLIGMLISHTDSNSMHWITGESEIGFRSLITGYGYTAENRARTKLEKNGHRSKMEIDLFSSHMGFDNNIKTLASWWELWKLVPNLLYYINRYEDDCFTDKFIESLNRLIARIMLLREAMKVDICDEKVLLWKYKLFCKDKRDWQEKIDWLRKMTQIEMQGIVEDNGKSKDEEPSYPNGMVKSIDPIFGKVPSLDGLVKEVMEKAKCDENQAMQALSICNEDVAESVVFAIDRKKLMSKHAKNKKGAKK